MPANDPTDRVLTARIAANTRWAHEVDRTAATAPARAAMLAKFEREADPDGTMSPQERAGRAERLRKAHFARLALASAKARRRRSERNPNGIRTESAGESLRESPGDAA